MSNSKHVRIPPVNLAYRGIDAVDSFCREQFLDTEANFIPTFAPFILNDPHPEEMR